MIIRPKHVILVLRSLSYNKPTEFYPVSRHVSRLLELQRASFHCTAKSRSIFRSQQEQHVDTDVPDSGQPMEAWYYDVKKDGRLLVRSAMDVHVQPLDPQKHPSMNKLFINILYMGKDRLSSSELTALTKQYIVNVDLDDTNEEMEISIKHKSSLPVPALCHLQVPIRYGIDVCCSKTGEASLENLESENIRVRTQQGNCTFKSIKGFNVDVQSKEGSVMSSKVLQGNVKIVCGGNGSINVGRLQGQVVNCHSDQGDISAKAIYADNATFTANCGNIHLGSCHGNSEVKINEGHLTVDTLDGNLNGSIESGNTQIALSREGNVSFEVESGDISLSVPKSLNCSMELCGTQIDMGEVTVHDSKMSEDSNLTKLAGHLSEEPVKGTIETRTNKGRIRLSYYDWLSSLNLSGK
ncbi:protein FAM185A-like [Mercenaria mercenaria]|uniref:protein FAM185A-like n=1 Tax=Mercenaria mercenaria TaxID=6596 RepID=UPI00234EFE32|nr:protein FAM185A-like [Mercenaria mercenaria]